MGFKKDDPGTIPKSSFNSSLVFTPCPLFGVQFKIAYFLKTLVSYINNGHKID